MSVSLTTVVEIVTAAALVFGVIFGAIQLRHLRDQRRAQSELELVHSFQTSDFVRGLVASISLPEGLSKKEIEAHLGDDILYAYLLMTTWESLGVLVYRKELPLRVVEDFFSGPVVLSWRNLRLYVAEYRAETGRETVFEWFQWLAERIMAHESREPATPAHIEHKSWK